MSMFEDLHADRIVGSLTTFDRMIFKGHLTRLYAPGAISAMLWRLGYPLTEFTKYATAATDELTANAKALAADAGRPYFYSDHSRRRGRTLHATGGRLRAARCGTMTTWPVVSRCDGNAAPRRSTTVARSVMPARRSMPADHHRPRRRRAPRRSVGKLLLVSRVAERCASHHMETEEQRVPAVVAREGQNFTLAKPERRTGDEITRLHSTGLTLSVEFRPRVWVNELHAAESATRCSVVYPTRRPGSPCGCASDPEA
jgi:hypothetical protein